MLTIDILCKCTQDKNIFTDGEITSKESHKENQVVCSS